MNQHSAAMHRCLRDCDVDGAMKLWKHVRPGLPQPKTRAEAEITLHYARTLSEKIDFKARAYSHAWLTNNGYPSGLPDKMKPRAERTNPVIKSSVGIALGFSSKLLTPVIPLVTGPMHDSVMDSYASRVTDPEVIKDRYLQEKDKALTKLFGNFEKLVADAKKGRIKRI